MRFVHVVGSLGALALATAVACSAPSEDDSDVSEDQIQGGHGDNDHRFAVGVQLANGGVCSGVLIAPNLVMTAQHCVSASTGGRKIDCGASGFNARPMRSTDLTITTDMKLPGQAKYKVANVVVPESQQFCGNDIALLVLTKNVPDNEARPAQPVLRGMNKISTIAAIGYGVTSAGGKDVGERRIKEDIPVACLPGSGSSSACKGISESKREFVTKGGVCEGDSGSGAFDPATLTAKNPKVLGILSRVTSQGTTCSAGVYTRTDIYARLIIGTAIQAARQGNYEPAPWTRPDGTSAGSMPDFGNEDGPTGQPQPKGRPPGGSIFGNSGWGGMLDWLGGWMTNQPEGADEGRTRYDQYGDEPTYDESGYDPANDQWNDGVWFPGDGGSPLDGGGDAGASSTAQPPGGDRATEASETPAGGDAPPEETPAEGAADAGAKKKKKKEAGGCSAAPTSSTSSSACLFLPGIAAVLVARARRRRR